jgi:hypothetical protein
MATNDPQGYLVVGDHGGPCLCLVRPKGGGPYRFEVRARIDSSAQRLAPDAALRLAVEKAPRVPEPLSGRRYPLFESPRAVTRETMQLRTQSGRRTKH